MIALMTEQEILSLNSIIQETQTLTLSSIEDDGSCRATPLFYWASDTFEFYCLSSGSSQHTINLKRDDRVSGALYPSVTNWKEIRGLQFKGRADILVGSERRQALNQYKKRFPFVVDLINLIHKSELIRIHPVWIRLVDNRRGFGNHQEWQLGEM